MTTTNPSPDRIATVPRAVALTMLRALYDQLPTVACRGLCHDACTIVGASQLERDVLETHGVELSNKPPRMVIEQAQQNPDGKIGEQCPALSPFGRCTVYADRPFICRAFGTVSHPAVRGPERFEQAMMCDHGCEPDSTMTVETFVAVMSQIEILSRAATGIARQPVAGDSRRLLGLFARDERVERYGFGVGPDVHRHHTEQQTGKKTRVPRVPAEVADEVRAITRQALTEARDALDDDAGGRRDGHPD